MVPYLFRIIPVLWAGIKEVYLKKKKKGGEKYSKQTKTWFKVCYNSKNYFKGYELGPSNSLFPQKLHFKWLTEDVTQGFEQLLFYS